jgi:lysophospholipase L1-like esterase
MVVLPSGAAKPVTTTFGLAEKLASGQSLIIQALGDSTVYGAYDTDMSGWVGRLGVNFGKAFNKTVKAQQYNAIGVYNPAVTLNTGIGSNQIVVRDAGEPGWTTTGVYYSLNTMLNISDPDLIIHGTGFNDINQGNTPAQFVSYIQLLITGIKTKCPGVPIIITTENVANSSSYNAAFNALSNDLVGQSLPVYPPLLASTTISGVWLMDTRQAFGNVWQSSLMTDTLHPTAAGYQAQADWMYELLVAGYGGAGVTPGADAITITNGTPSITAIPTTPFTGRSIGKPKYRIIDKYYPVTPKIKTSAGFTTIRPVD